MNVLQINSGDVVGSRFNGFDLRERLAGEGITSQHLVWTKQSSDPASEKFANLPGIRYANAAAGRLERRFSMHGRLQAQSFATPLHKVFRQADVIHYHIVHDGFFSLDALPFLMRRKPSVWTWHDPWIMTGHCIYPMECQRWQIGCGSCPHLDRPFAMREDRSAEQFAWKKRLVQSAKAEIVVASEHMRQMALRSPIAAGKPMHVIPFGIDLTRFSGQDREAARQRLGILPGRLVLGFRAFAGSPFKGFEYLVQALKMLDDVGVPLTLLTTHDKAQLDTFIGRHQVIDLGWVNDEALMLDSFAATDLFVMPSTAEAFGMMAIEAMACSKPIIVFDGTSLAEVTDAPRIGVAVPMRDAHALAAAMRRLITDADERRARGEAGRVFAEAHYSDRVFAARLADLYRKVATR